jgi:hypothetical protein
MSNDLDEFKKSGKELGWTEEDVEVPLFTPKLDEKHKRVSITQTTEKLKQKVYYAHSVPRMVICSDHFFMPLDPKKYIFKCRKCDYHYKANTLTHQYEPTKGKLLFRHNKQVAV